MTLSSFFFFFLDSGQKLRGTTKMNAEQVYAVVLINKTGHKWISESRMTIKAKQATNWGYNIKWRNHSIFICHKSHDETKNLKEFNMRSSLLAAQSSYQCHRDGRDHK